MKEFCLVKDTSFSELGDVRELDRGSALRQNVNLVLNDPPYSTRSTRYQVKAAHDEFFQEYFQNAARIMSTLMAPRGHDHFFRSNVLLRQGNRNLHRQTETIKIVRNRNKYFRTSLQKMNRLSGTRRAAGCTTVILVVANFSRDSSLNRPFISGEKV